MAMPVTTINNKPKIKDGKIKKYTAFFQIKFYTGLCTSYPHNSGMFFLIHWSRCLCNEYT
ncbi:hypothetical protein SAMN05421788_114122 [Filimonas lacunae]|uniref:Uncharacterized protein n=1 Tax=Filimonas lacunae TaxID=477680 RepID=A0A1N7RG29_9BACT|nr:hypothetical protein SAMN05421788_114122 [Filimonas lacunae]